MGVQFSSKPFVTVIMPVRNEAAFVARSLTAVLTQDYPPDYMEVIVSDGMSTDGTREIVQSFQARHSHLLLIDNYKKIVPTGLNAAIQRAKGEVLIRVDGHCIIAPDYVTRCVQHLKQDNVAAVGGSIETVGESFVAHTISLAMSFPFGVGDSAFRTMKCKTMFVDTFPFPAYKREAIEQAGLFDEELVRNQDDEYNYRLRKLGAKILLADDVRSFYYSRSTLLTLWRQYVQYGYWKVRVLQKHPWQMRPRQFVPPAFVASLILMAFMSLFFTFAQGVLGVVVSAYLLANGTASVFLALKRGWKHLPLLPLIFAILHFSYGLGFLVGMVRFANRWRDRQGKVPSLSSSR